MDTITTSLRLLRTVHVWIPPLSDLWATLLTKEKSSFSYLDADLRAILAQEKHFEIGKSYSAYFYEISTGDTLTTILSENTDSQLFTGGVSGLISCWLADEKLRDSMNWFLSPNLSLNKLPCIVSEKKSNSFLLGGKEQFNKSFAGNVLILFKQVS